MTDIRSWSIRQLCREFDATPRALRFYESKGLISPRRVGQTRIYGPRERARLSMIMRGRRLGFSLDEIGELMDLYDRDDGNIVQFAETLKRSRDKLDALKRQRDDLEAAIGELEEGCAWLERRVAERRPDLLPHADKYHAAMSAGLEDQQSAEERARETA